MLSRLTEKKVTTASLVADGHDTAIDMDKVSTLSVQAVIDVTGISGGAIAFQKSNITTSDGNASTTDADWTDVQTETAVSADGTTWYEQVGPCYRWFRVRWEVGGGSMVIVLYYLTRGSQP